MGGKQASGEFVPYSRFAHPSRKKRASDGMTYQQTVEYVLDKM